MERNRALAWHAVVLGHFFVHLCSRRYKNEAYVVRCDGSANDTQIIQPKRCLVKMHILVKLVKMQCRHEEMWLRSDVLPLAVQYRSDLLTKACRMLNQRT